MSMSKPVVFIPNVLSDQSVIRIPSTKPPCLRVTSVVLLHTETESPS